jgi:hypothetical protein
MKKKKIIFWAVIAAAVIFVFNILHEFLGGHRGFEGGMRGGHGRGASVMGQAGGFGHHGGFEGHQQFMGGAHFGGGIPWLAILIGLAVLVLLVKWLKNKAKTSSMNEFIDTTLVSSQTPVNTQNASILDQWEKNVSIKKENE